MAVVPKLRAEEQRMALTAVSSACTPISHVGCLRCTFIVPFLCIERSIAPNIHREHDKNEARECVVG